MPTYPFDTIQTGNATFPKLLFEDQSGDPATPDSGKLNLYPKDGQLHVQDDAGNVRNIEAVQQALTADPSPLVDGMVWYFDDGGSPASLVLRWRKAGVTYEFPIGTAAT